MTCRNYSSAFIDGSQNLRSSAFKDHAKSDMHQRAMLLLRKASAIAVTDYSPIARAFSSIHSATEERVKKQFEIAYMLSKENLSFSKMNAICQLEQQHGVDLGQSYKSRQACTTFVEYIALSLRQQLAELLNRAKFFSVQADGSTDAANIEEELFIALFFDPYSQDVVVRVRSKFLAVRQPLSGNAVGLHESFTKALSRVGIENWKQKLVGFGCDGASVNMGANGLRGLLEQDVPWVIGFWCLIHRLQLALKDSLKSTYFASVDEMLTQLYLLYEKSPKKCRELDEIVESLKMCISNEDLPSAGGNRPLRACGARFVGHKVSALNCLVDRYGAYLAHILELTEDPRVKAADKQRLKGYYKKWHDGRIILACAFFHDVLKPCATLSLALQAEHVNVIDAIEAVLRTKKSMEQLKSTIFSELPTVKKVMSRVHKSGNNITYQETELVRYDEAVTYLTLSKDNVIEGIMACLKDRLTIHHSQLLKDCLTLLATHGW